MNVQRTAVRVVCKESSVLERLLELGREGFIVDPARSLVCLNDAVPTEFFAILVHDERRAEQLLTLPEVYVFP